MENMYIQYQKKIEEFKIPKQYEKISMINYNNKIFRMFLLDNSLCWFPHFLNRKDFDFTIQNLRIISIPCASIQYYKIEGEIRHELQITGGGGGGSSIKGAIAGHLIAGGIGAIIGSRKKVDEIQSKTVEIDDRKLVLYYLDKNTSKKMIFHHEDINAFRHLIPEKEYGYQKADIQNNRNDSINITDQIEKLFQLVEKGILTEDEFIAKKKELLSRI